MTRIRLFLAPLASSAVVFSIVSFALISARPAQCGAQTSRLADMDDDAVTKESFKSMKGTTITIALPENAPDRVWNDELLSRFQNLTGIRVQVLRPGNDTTQVLFAYLNDLHSSTPQADVYAIDIVWPAVLSPYAEDLHPAFGDLAGVDPELIANDTVHGRLVAAPYFVEVSMLYYRPDLLRKYHFSHPPRTWNELEHQALIIQAGERRSGNPDFWGYLWQGAESEALTCNALEWQVSQGAASLISSTGLPVFQSEGVRLAWSRAHHWVGTISPPEVVHQLEDDSLRTWMNGNAAFMRNWPYAWRESQGQNSRLRGKVAVALLPRGEGRASRHAETLGGFQLMISNRSQHKQAAIELIRFLTSPQVQRHNAISRGYLPTRLTEYDDPAILKANPFLADLRESLLEHAVTRPSTESDTRYDAVSRALFTAVHKTLTGELTPSGAVAAFERNLKGIAAQAN